MLEEFLRYFGHSTEDGPGPRQTTNHVNSLGLALATCQQISEVSNFVQIIFLHDGIKVAKELMVILGEVFFLEDLC